ncbi:Cupin domain protein [Pleurostoma richardsiae]|uniref:Cupin domain protein n=1 Tax=Pleurostoma richardsiae TaxID=41990 RepID=A0AA38RQF8_9PEZI|nr:Cupin domain protein [Pleurostoma richardsiae]
MAARFLNVLFLASLAVAAPAVRRANTTAAVDQALPQVIKANPRGNDAALIQSLLLAPTQKERINLLNQPGDTIFDFTNPPAGATSTGKGGNLVSANAESFPALIGNGAAMSVAFLGPCGLNSPHVHNRATELNIPVKGRLVTSFFEENGVTARQDLLNTYSMAVFPQGAIHSEYNPDCEDAVFVAGFNNPDPGVEQVAQAFFNLRSDIIQASLDGVSMLNGEDIDSFKDILPANIVQGVETCLAKCGISKKAKRDLAEVLSA